MTDLANLDEKFAAELSTISQLPENQRQEAMERVMISFLDEQGMRDMKPEPGPEGYAFEPTFIAVMPERRLMNGEGIRDSRGLCQALQSSCELLARYALDPGPEETFDAVKGARSLMLNLHANAEGEIEWNVQVSKDLMAVSGFMSQYVAEAISPISAEIRQKVSSLLASAVRELPQDIARADVEAHYEVRLVGKQGMQ